ncbi:MAG: M67 family metallopeptidase [Vicinamibacteraceae bacterium]
MNTTAGHQVQTRRLLVSPTALARIREHGQMTYPLECCGAVVGDGDALEEAWPLPNTSGESQERRFLVSPAEYRALERRVAEAGRQLLGFYHSHPDHPAQPSVHDLAAAWPGFVYLILSVRKGAPAELTGWRLREDRSQFDEVEVVAER